MGIMETIRRGLTNFEKNTAKKEDKAEKTAKKKMDLATALDILEEGYGTKPKKSNTAKGIAGKLDRLEEAYTAKASNTGGFWNNTPDMGSTSGRRPFYENTVSLHTTVPSTAMGSSLAHEKKKKKKHHKKEH